jgi:hypothetical protein
MLNLLGLWEELDAGTTLLAMASGAAGGTADAARAASLGPWVGLLGIVRRDDSAARTATALRGIMIARAITVNRTAAREGWKRGESCFVLVFKFIP